MSTVYRVAAWGVVGVHLAVLAFVAVGALLALRWRWVVWVHAPFAAWAGLMEGLGWTCPLTVLEKWLRMRAGVGVYEGGFISHYLLGRVLGEGRAQFVEVALAFFAVGVSVLVYLMVAMRVLEERRGGLVH